MRYGAIVALSLLLLSTSAEAQGRLPVEAKSHVTVLVDLSATWLNEKSKNIDEQELEAVAQAVSVLVPSLKPPVEIQYLEIGDASLSRAPLCSARYSPSIFPSMAGPSEFADLKKLNAFFGEDCTRLILMRTPEKFTDITGALNTVSRIASFAESQYSAIIMLSDFQEERRRNQKGNVGSLKGMHTLLLYRVLDADRLDPTKLDARIGTWQSRLRSAGASVETLDDISLEPAQMKRLLMK